MDLLRQLLLIVHILGFAALLGGLFVQLPDATRKVNSLMRDGSGTAFVAGLALVGVLEAGDADVNHVKVGVKLLVGFVVLGMVMANVRKERIPNGLFFAVLALTLANVAVAVLWSSVHAA